MRLVVINHVTLDGVTQAPADPDEDLRGGFKHGGWELPYGDAVMMEALGFGPGSKPPETAGAAGGGLLLGRCTYEHFYKVWPKRTGNPFTAVLNKTRKYVASRTLKEPLPWESSFLLQGELSEAVTRLKQEPGDRLVVLGSGDLVQSLMRAQLVDEILHISGCQAVACNDSSYLAAETQLESQKLSLRPQATLGGSRFSQERGFLGVEQCRVHQDSQPCGLAARVPSLNGCFRVALLGR